MQFRKIGKNVAEKSAFKKLDAGIKSRQTNLKSFQIDVKSTRSSRTGHQVWKT